MRPLKIDCGVVAQLVRASDCRSEGCGFEPHPPRHLIKNSILKRVGFFVKWHVVCGEKGAAEPLIERNIRAGEDTTNK